MKPPSVKRGFLRRLLREVEEHGERKLELARYDRLLGDPDYHLLKQLTSLDVNAMLKRYMSKLHQHHAADGHIGARSAGYPCTGRAGRRAQCGGPSKGLRAAPALRVCLAPCA